MPLLARLFENLFFKAPGKEECHGQEARKHGVIDRLVAGGDAAPITHWSDQHLERMIKTNSVFRENADELREAHHHHPKAQSAATENHKVPSRTSSQDSEEDFSFARGVPPDVYMF
eukprot:TRINITY_DN67108_c0_g1_i1.p1 TRINITY_DN67108_c0_g1~~TRINITY_DN67108_c0_g1_i1.p1  ORF type:complete len:116 (-),score=21.77 TRINITY_DN67108_c0_g1_i1:119-466(-)